MGFRKRLNDLIEEQKLLRAHTQSLKSSLTQVNTSGKRITTITRNMDDVMRKYAISVRMLLLTRHLTRLDDDFHRQRHHIYLPKRSDILY